MKTRNRPPDALDVIDSFVAGLEARFEGSPTHRPQRHGFTLLPSTTTHGGT